MFNHTSSWGSQELQRDLCNLSVFSGAAHWAETDYSLSADQYDVLPERKCKGNEMYELPLVVEGQQWRRQFHWATLSQHVGSVGVFWTEKPLSAQPPYSCHSAAACWTAKAWCHQCRARGCSWSRQSFLLLQLLSICKLKKRLTCP